MTPSLALLHILAASSTKTSGGSPVFLFLLVGVAVVGYFFFLRPQQRKAQAARANLGSGYEVGDEVQTIGGVIGTILEIHGDRYTLLTGSVGPDGNLDGAQPTRIVFVRQAIARKVDPVVEADPDIDVDADEHEGYGLGQDAYGEAHENVEVDDDGPSEAEGHHDGEAGEA
jgi:preprotein translocase subunit YajC